MPACVLSPKSCSGPRVETSRPRAVGPSARKKPRKVLGGEVASEDLLLIHIDHRCSTGNVVNRALTLSTILDHLGCFMSYKRACCSLVLHKAFC